MPGSMKKISIGRADLMVPEDATLTMKGEVNEVEVTTVAMKPGETFTKLWNERLKSIASGAGEGPAHTAIRKRYPENDGTGQVYFEQGSDPGILVVMERWKASGNLLVKAQEKFEPKFLSGVEQDMEKVFSSMSVGGIAGPGDFAVDSVIFHLLPDNGGESSDALVRFELPGKDPVHMALHVTTELLSTAGSVTVINRVKQGPEGAAAAGVKVDTLRLGKRSIGSLQGEEGVVHVTGGPDGSSNFRAEWGGPGVAHDAYSPQTSLTLQNDMGGHPDVETALAYWDGISSSLRFRK